MVTGVNGLRVRRALEQIEKGIRSGVWPPGTLLPSIRELASRYGGSRESVRRAVALLASQGIVEPVPGSGTLVRQSPLSSTSEEPLPRPQESRCSASPAIMPPRRLIFATSEFGTDKSDLWSCVVRRFAIVQRRHGARMKMMLRGLDGLGDLGGADILHAAGYDLWRLARDGRLLDLRPLIRQTPGLLADMVPGLVSTNGDEPCPFIPIAFDVEMLCLNLDRIPPRMLDRLSEAWDLPSLVGWAADLASEVGGRPVRFPRPHVLIAALGIDVARVLEAEEGRSRLLEAVETLLTCHRRYPIHADDIRSRDVHTLDQQQFVAGEARVVFQHTFALPLLRRTARFAWAVRSFPRPPGTVSRCWPLGCGISRDCLFPEEAFAFLRFVSGPEGQRILAGGKNNIPARRATLREAVWLAPPPEGLGELARSLGTVRSWDEWGPRSLTVPCLAVWDDEILSVLEGKQSALEAVGKIEDRCGALRAAHGNAT